MREAGKGMGRELGRMQSQFDPTGALELEPYHSTGPTEAGGTLSHSRVTQSWGDAW